MRHYFTQAHDKFAIIDNKQQRLAEGDSMNAELTSPEIAVAGQDRVNVEFDHHYRQGKDGQNATVQVSFDGGKPQEIATFNQDVFSKHESIGVDVPAGTKNMQVSFKYNHGNDDWWWAVDNVGVIKPLSQEIGAPQAVVDVLSDIQGDPEDYKDAVRQLNGMEDKAGALVLNGDLVDDGSQEQWDAFLAAHKKYLISRGRNCGPSVTMKCMAKKDPRRTWTASLNTLGRTSHGKKKLLMGYR